MPEKERCLQCFKDFLNGTSTDAYRFLGAHRRRRGGKTVTVFSVWAPKARAVSVIGDFNNWDAAASPAKKHGEFFITEIPGVKKYDKYRFVITGADSVVREKSDPYAFHAETSPQNASKFFDIGGYKWGDGDYIDARNKKDIYSSPMNIYEVDLSSWRKYPDGSFFGYKKAAEELADYVKKMNYTHIELLPLTEHPFGGSWGYQVTGYFAPTSRYGTPHDFMAFVDIMHQNGIGVILDWVPAHFPKDGFGLYEFDGGFLYESPDPFKREVEGWGTRAFDYSNPSVRSFLISSALYWLREYHVDGLRVDAVASMLYLDYGRERGQWRPNIYGSNENLEAVDFIKKLNEAVFAEFPNALMIAEESTAWPMVTGPTYSGGLGFNFKWNMGWMNDTLKYISQEPVYRKYNQGALTFSFYYAFSENFILPVSHDEVVHGKCSLINKIPGSYEEKFATLRAFLGYMTAHPGKKLLFMGQEFGQFIEWDYTKELDWLLLDYDAHRRMQLFTMELNRFYLESPPLYQIDRSWEGFSWIANDDTEGSTVIFRRFDKAKNELTVICRFCDIGCDNYRFGVPFPGEYEVVFSSDDCVYGGSGRLCSGMKAASENIPMHGSDQSVSFNLPPLCTVFLRYSGPRIKRLAGRIKKEKLSDKQYLKG